MAGEVDIIKIFEAISAVHKDVAELCGMFKQKEKQCELHDKEMDSFTRRQDTFESRLKSLEDDKERRAGMSELRRGTKDNHRFNWTTILALASNIIAVAALAMAHHNG